ncbi:hypothetical protein GOP47_0017195 [Adiantum capillus-veneris]|uniref:RING-type E3 ubiquitin transferase n=1 Tax=Adiantum capillus-veneris TaxID=13818 RepID=A0A9D4UJ82_ADICA|nr:hypothetical protein GOP47_0017195 [Adiantum capillus-veneris]
MMRSHEHLQAGSANIGSTASRAETSPCTPLHASHDHHDFACTEEAHLQQSTFTGAGGATQNFECGICLDVCYDPVVTMCGHLFCWPCLYHWLSLHSACSECPVCKKQLQQNMVIPLYGHGKVACPEFLADRFPGVRIPCRPSSPTVQTNASHEPLVTSAMITHGSDLAHIVNVPSSNLGCWRNIAVLQLQAFMSLLPAWMDGRFEPGTGIPVVAERRRFNNEKEFALHWAFIIFAIFATLGFTLC